MTGFEPDRFVNDSGIDLDEFTCGICHGIFIKPVVTDCCQQTYCYDCINQWLNHSNTCPNDRKLLRKEQLRPMARAFVNLLDNLKITCDYRNEGCLSSVKICELDNHIKECEYRPNIVCKVCQTIRESVSTHNCIESLMIEKNKIVAKNDMILENYNVLRRGLEQQQNSFEKGMDAMNEQFQTEINQIKIIQSIQISEISSNFKKRMDQLKLENVNNILMLQGELDKSLQDFKELDPQNPGQIIIEAREHIKSLNLIRYDKFQDFLKDDLLENTQKAILNTENNSFERISQSILKNIENFSWIISLPRWKIYVYGNENNRPKESLIKMARGTCIIQIKRLEITILYTKTE